MRKILGTVLAVLVIIGMMGLVVSGSKGKRDGKMDGEGEEKEGRNDLVAVFYYGDTCPHCRETEEWMEKNKVEEKIEIEKKEVYRERKNLEELERVARGCGLEGEIGVPFLYAEGKCFVGSVEIESYLKEKLGLQE